MTVSRSMEQVWEWKQAVYEDIKDMDTPSRLAYFRAVRKRLEEKLGVKLEVPPPGRRRRKRR